MRFVRKNFASLKPEDINERTLIVDTARGQYPWLNKEVAEVITDIIELAPTEELHQKFQARKSEFKEQGLTNGIAHYKAFTATDYEEEFREEFDDDLVQDLIDNEFAGYDTIIFSCWCASNSPCHTDILVDMFSKAIESTEQVTLFDVETFEASEKDDSEWDAELNKTRKVSANAYWSDRFSGYTFFKESWWKSFGRNAATADPDLGIPHKYYRPPARKGHCHICGKQVRKTGKARRAPKYCKECIPKARKLTFAEKNRRAMNSRESVGTVPARLRTFLYYVKNFYGLKYYNNSDISEFTKYDPNEHAAPKGVEPERAEAVVCPECGGRPQLYKPWKPINGHYGKIGSSVLCCKECGLVLSNTGLKSFAPVTTSGYLGN